FYGSSAGTPLSWQNHLKHMVTRFCTNIAVSQAIAQTLPGKSHVIPNPYSDDLFFRIPDVPKKSDLFFVGRMVSDKGIDVLIDALAKLRDRGLTPSLTLAGSGPEEKRVRERIDKLRLSSHVKFVGRVNDKTLNELLNVHRIMIVPTREG